MTKFRRVLNPAAIAIAISVVLHLTLLSILPLLAKKNGHVPPHTMEVVLWPKGEEALQKNEPIVKKSVVKIEPQNNSPRPQEAKFLAESDQSTDREQQRARTHSRPAGAIAKKASTSKRAEPKGHPEPKADMRRDRTADQGEAHRLADPLGIMPTFDGVSAPARPSGDMLDGIEEGDETRLNAWQWRHAPFFNRIKERVASTWAPGEQIARYDPNGSSLGQMDRITVMRVTIDRSGQLKKLDVKDSSGISYLDDEAKSALMKAAPFIYPPRELFLSHQEFTFSFAFHLKIDRGFHLDLKWRPD